MAADDDVNDIWQSSSGSQGGGQESSKPSQADQGEKKEKQPSDDKEKKKSKKTGKEDMLKAAAQEQMGGFNLMSRFIGNEEETKSEADTNESEQEEDDIDDQEDDEAKKELPTEKQKIGLSQMEEDRLKQIDPKDLEEKSFEFEDGSSKLKAVLAVIAICVALTAGYFFFFAGGDTQARVLLSTEPISKENYEGISNTPGEFALGKKIYVFFVTGGRIGVDTIHFKILEEITKPGNQVELMVVGQAQRTVRPNWRPGISTHFQSQYFDHAGTYIIQILSPTGELMAENKFVIKGGN